MSGDRPPRRVTADDGGVVALHDLGGEGPTVLVCHATGLCGRAYERLAQALTGYHVWALDVRGHGDSPPPADGDFAWAGMTRDVAAAAAALPGPVHAVGHSMGGATALAAEAARPGTFATAYVYEPIVPAAAAPKPAENPLADSARRRRAVFASRQEALWRYASRPPLDQLEAGSLAAYVAHGFVDQPDGTVRLACSGEAEARTFEASGVITTGTVATAALPTVVATGDPRTSLAHLAVALVDALPHAELRSFEQLAHFGPLQAPTVVAADIREHLRAHA